jgi:hypothetical protein
VPRGFLPTEHGLVSGDGIPHSPSGNEVTRTLANAEFAFITSTGIGSLSPSGTGQRASDVAKQLSLRELMARKQESLPWPRRREPFDGYICQDSRCDKLATDHWGALYFCYDERVKKYGF